MVFATNKKVKIILPFNWSNLPNKRLESVKEHEGQVGRITRIREDGVYVRFGVFGSTMFFFLFSCIEMTD